MTVGSQLFDGITTTADTATATVGGSTVTGVLDNDRAGRDGFGGVVSVTHNSVTYDEASAVYTNGALTIDIQDDGPRVVTAEASAWLNMDLSKIRLVFMSAIPPEAFSDRSTSM